MTSKPLTDSDIQLILLHLHHPRDRALFVLGLKTGFRISELLSLTIQNVLNSAQNGIAASVSVPRKQMKGKERSRSVPLHAMCNEFILVYLKSLNHPKLDITPDSLVKIHVTDSLNPLNVKLFPITRRHAWHVIKKAAEVAGLEGCISTHSMRKTFGMRVYEKTGKDIVATQKALGHKSLSSTTHYLSVDQEIIDAAIVSD